MVKIAFLHPDLGIGGAERLIVDAAMALKSCGHDVQMFTAHHDTQHCFEETRDGSLTVTCVGDWLPRRLFGRCYALCAFIRMIYVALYVVWTTRPSDFDLFVCDQVSACIPVLRWFKSNTRVLFYCHFPDMLLTSRDNWLKSTYRYPLDWLEEKTTGMAHTILVNSKFTANTYTNTFKSLTTQPAVLYPSLNFEAFDVNPEPPKDWFPPSVKTIFLSINRYERKKNLMLALEALNSLRSHREVSDHWKGIHLIMAGGYDDRVIENVEHYQELREFTTRNDLDDHVTFLRSFSDAEKLSLLDVCTALIYTPSNEHFGICPLEAMYMQRPVIAANSGGPLESVAHNETGFLCEPTSVAFADAMLHFVHNPESSRQMGELGRRRVVDRFSFEAFTSNLDKIVRQTLNVQ